MFETQAGRDELQAAVFAGVLRACVESAACSVFQSWGFTDRFSWRDGTWGDGAKAAAPSALDDQTALMFDQHYEPKLAAFEMLAVLREAARARSGATAGGTELEARGGPDAAANSPASADRDSLS
jgi:GH35 family endo-1,4-beta-xylanase